jgi:hypothetical protein
MPPDNISRSAAKEAIESIQYIGDHMKRDLLAALDSLPAAEADVMDREPDNPAEIIRQIIAHCDADSLPDFVSALNPKDERRIRDARSWIVTVGQLRAFLKAIERPPSPSAAEGAEKPAEILNWMRLYGELYCQLWAATETEFAVVVAGGELDHAGTLREIKRLNDNDISNSVSAAQLRGEG